MSETRLTYAVITAARDEAESLPRLAASLGRQLVRPDRWIIVENGSRDATMAVGFAIAAEDDTVLLLAVPSPGPRERGAPIVRALNAGLAALEPLPDIVVNVDADVTFEPDYFERLLDAFSQDASLGIASGSAWELEGGSWKQRFVTGGTVWGATRAYRRACLQDILPLQERHGWDGIDQLEARAQGWRTRTLLDLPFYHHRKEGLSDGSSWAHWQANGDTAYFMGYRPSYLLARTAHNLGDDIGALGLVVGYVSAALKRSPRLENAAAREVLRDDQRLRNLLRRRREARGAADQPPTRS